MNQWLKLALEAGPLVVFFVGNAKFGILPATGAFMAATVAALITNYVLERKVPVMPLVAGVFIVIFGGLTVMMEDDTFIKLKPTVVNLLFALALFTGLAFKRNLLKIAFRMAFTLDDEGWRILTWRWAFFFVALAAANEVVWRTQSTDFWVNFKVFGILPATLLFSLTQLPLILRHRMVEDEA